ncbi:phytoene desaturase family protein [Tuwongella immobilis]|uniref:Pyridine nucleotide-disulfide oxidoreductase domain-containing protein 2 n=1 Tax=Tuwongella immobilis TaxID=692036 RepID=A0A6C2YX37_9BACT|nr:NAD(P)/FAD-dependent oxidoreductase [Tuwongella immobilis]VIP05459.1 amine oxidase : Phytoene dehydrogenase-related protein OS=Blastopirellula marina DSM 3645 GN=DSM3645_00225 PE=4 SV=1: NAD_binding_8 [Tuwongella immobilis]VTS08274.1 amine oxidase : Phytoene dehydrogenase-related protein OS=Blastopirellula marina DSM 3645 GN=DSM3645_00225 PE=4 SV=1: NAD_binding_8 [Tuwongella immobilis]
MAKRYDAIIIGAGHNGLVTAAYLARAGYRVLVLERREVLGGCAVTEEVWPGYRVSTAAYVNSLFRPEIIRDLELKRFGFQMLPRNPSSFTPFPDGRYLMMGPDAELNRREVGKFSARDAERLPEYEAMLTRVADFLEPLLVETPPDPWSFRPGDWWKLGKIGYRFLKLGRRDAVKAIEILTGAARPILDRWFESEQLKVTLATDAVIGVMASPSMPGTAYVLFHHVMGECDGARGVWGYVRGGMGSLSNAIADSARRFGAEIVTNAEVERILIREGRVEGVALRNGNEYLAPRVASGVDANLTFRKFCDAKELPPEFLAAVSEIDYTSATLKINVCLNEVPNFIALPNSGAAHIPGPQHRGTMHICPTMDYLERAYDDAKYGRPSQSPILECTMATTVDDSLAPPGKHLMSMFVQYAPYHLREGNWDDIKESFADRCFDILNEYAPNFKQSVIARQILTPVDLERIYGLTGGNIFQGSMSLSSMFSLRPVAGFCQYRTPIAGLYLCGAAAHPGGGVLGAAGWNAAREILRDR